MSFLYFIPDVDRETFTADHIRAAGLDGIFRDRMSPNDVAGLGGLVIARVIRGPKGHAGIILQAGNRYEELPQAVGYFPDRQDWIDCGRYWIGHDREHLPTPEQLQRDDTIAGPDEVLEDGKVWEVPCIRMEQDGNRLPCNWKLVNGRIVPVVKREFAWAWELSGHIWDWHSSGSKVPLETIYEWCAKVLSLNYRVGPEELSILNTIGSTSYQKVLDAAIAGKLLSELREAQKKTLEHQPAVSLNS